jgi:hypothetical protein
MDSYTVNKLEEAFALGCSDEEACFYAGISKQTLYNFQNKNDEFLDRKSLLKQRPVLKARQSVVNSLEKNPMLALKFLERVRKEEFSTQQQYYIESSHKTIALRDIEVATRRLLEGA